MSKNKRHWLWIIPDRYEGLWKLCLEHNVLAMGYDINHPKAAVEISPGDKVIVYLNKKTFGGIGRVTTNIYRAREEDSWENELGYSWLTRVDIEWETVDEYGWQCDDYFNLIGIKYLFTRTVHEMDFKYYKKVYRWIKDQQKQLDDSPRYIKPQKQVDLILASDINIKERALRDFLADNIELIFGESCEIFEDGEGNIGIEYDLETGSVDLMFINAEDKIVIVELKVVHARSEHVDQLKKYLENYEELFGEEALGMLIAPGITRSARKKLKSEDNISFHQFQLYFGLSEMSKVKWPKKKRTRKRRTISK